MVHIRKLLASTKCPIFTPPPPLLLPSGEQVAPIRWHTENVHRPPWLANNVVPQANVQKGSVPDRMQPDRHPGGGHRPSRGALRAAGQHGPDQRHPGEVGLDDCHRAGAGRSDRGRPGDGHRRRIVVAHLRPVSAHLRIVRAGAVRRQCGSLFGGRESGTVCGGAVELWNVGTADGGGDQNCAGDALHSDEVRTGEGAGRDCGTVPGECGAMRMPIDSWRLLLAQHMFAYEYDTQWIPAFENDFHSELSTQEHRMKKKHLS